MNRKDLIISSWISLGTALFFFTFFNGQKSVMAFLYTLGISAMYTFTIAIGSGWVNRYLNRRYSWVEKTRSRIIFGILMVVASNTAMVLALNYINFIVLQKKDPATFFTGEIGLFNWFMINFALMIAAFLHAKSFMEEWKKSTRREVVEQKLIARSANAQFESLKNQLDPHFLFNSLNVLSSLIEENSAQAQQFTGAMAKIYRYVLEQKDKELISLEEEISFAKTYAQLLKMRFEESIIFNFSTEENTGFLVPLSLQLLLENCIKHNFATPDKPLRINISTKEGFLIIENNLQPRNTEEESTGIGLSNIVSRYALLTDRNVFIEKSEHSYRIKIPVLTQKLKNMELQKNPENLAYGRAQKRVEELKGFYANLLSYCIVIPMLAIINLSSGGYQWFWWPMLGWGIGLISHAFKVFGLNSNWEDRKIKELMEKEKTEKWN